MPAGRLVDDSLLNNGRFRWFYAEVSRPPSGIGHIKDAVEIFKRYGVLDLRKNGYVHRGQQLLRE